MSKNTNELDQVLRRLVMETRQGDKASYESLLTRLSPFLRKGAAGYLSRFGRTSYAEDALQETLLAIHLKLHTYDPDQSFLAWSHAVLRHKIIDYLRRNKVKVVSIEEMEFWEPSDEATPEIQAASYDLQKLLAILKPPAGQIIYDMKVEGTTLQELSVRYSMSESNIKVIVHRGLKKLSEIIRKEIA